jgi:hypothetical protein
LLKITSSVKKYSRRSLVHLYANNRHQNSSHRSEPWPISSDNGFHGTFSPQPKTSVGTIGVGELKFQLSIQQLQNLACITKSPLVIVGFGGLFEWQIFQLFWYIGFVTHPIHAYAAKLVARGPRNDGINIIYFSIFSKFLAALEAMVANESRVWRT